MPMNSSMTPQSNKENGAQQQLPLLRELCAFTTDSACQLNILRHNGHTLGVNGTQVGIFKETNQVGLRSLLKSQNSGGLETEITLEVL